MRKMNLGTNSQEARLGINEMVQALCAIDTKLHTVESIILCGSASVILQGVNFRSTMDIDFAVLPSDAIIASVQDSIVFDCNAIGIIGLLVDFEDRLVQLSLGTRYLRVSCISKRDWIVSKLASPKLDDVLSREDITIQDLLWVRDHFHMYGGVSFIRAQQDLAYLIREKGGE